MNIDKACSSTLASIIKNEQVIFLLIRCLNVDEDDHLQPGDSVMKK